MSSDSGARDSCERLTVTKSFSELIEQGVLEIGDGYRAKNDELGGDGLIFLRAGHVRDTHIDFDGVDHFKAIDNSKLRSKLSVLGDVVVTTKGNSTGRIAFVTKGMPEFVYSPHLSFWRSKDESVLCQGFLRAWSRGGEFDSQLQAMCRSTDMAPYLSLTDQKRLQITLPSIERQREAAEILDGVEARIILLRETNATLEAIAQALFKSWFVDFDPVHAKAEGRQPEGMDATTAALFPDSFKASELGLVPKGWRIGNVGDLASQKKGSVNPLASPEVLFEHFSLPAFDNGQAPVVELGKEIKSNKTPLPEEAVLLSKLNPHIPRVWLPVLYGPNAVCSTEFLAYSPQEGASKELIYCLLSSESFQLQLCQLVTGTSNSHQRVTPDQVLVIKLPIADKPVLKAFTELVRSLFDRVHAGRLQAQTLTQLRDTLLPRLISGQLRLPEAEALLEGSL